MKDVTLVKCIILSMILISFLSAYDKEEFVNNQLGIVRLDTLDYEEIYIPASLKADFPYHIASSKAINGAYKLAQEKRDGYMIYMLSILEWDHVYTYGSLGPGRMLHEAFSIAEENADTRLAIYTFSQMMRFNLFSVWYKEDFFRHAEKLALKTQDGAFLLQIADYLEEITYIKDPSYLKFRAEAYALMDPVKIHDEEFIVFWDDFKACCKNKNSQSLPAYLDNIVIFIESSFGDIYGSCNYYPDELLKDFSEDGKGPGMLPVVTAAMDSVALGKPVKVNMGDAGTAFWSVGRSYDEPENEFKYEIGKYGPVSYSTSYFFRKFDGKIKLYKIVYDEM